MIKLIRAKDLTGLKFGKLVVVYPIRRDAKNVFWLCKCDCGGETVVSSSNLRNIRSVKSCGCLPLRFGKNSCTWKGCGELAGSVVSRIHQHAKIRGYEFAVDAKILWNLFEKQNGKCALSGLPITLPLTRKDMDNGKCTASLDRIDSKIGYIVGNIQWTHKDINLMKQSFPQEKFLEYCRLIYENS